MCLQVVERTLALSLLLPAMNNWVCQFHASLNPKHKQTFLALRPKVLAKRVKSSKDLFFKGKFKAPRRKEKSPFLRWNQLSSLQPKYRLVVETINLSWQVRETDDGQYWTDGAKAEVKMEHFTSCKKHFPIIFLFFFIRPHPPSPLRIERTTIITEWQYKAVLS